MRKPKGFTLIELLVVIAVIAVLMGVLIPALRRAKEMGQRTVCASHLRTLALANEAYASTYDGAYAPVVYGTSELHYWLNNSSFRSCLHLDSYKSEQDLGDFDIPNEFLCPSDRISKDTVNALSRVLTSYGYNYTEWKQPASASMAPINGYGGHFAHKIKQPAERLAFTDGIDWWVDWQAADYSDALDEHDGWGWDKLGQANIRTYKDKGLHGPTFYRHNEGANVAFYDGHVTYMKKEDIFVLEDFEADPKRPGMWVADLRFYLKNHP